MIPHIPGKTPRPTAPVRPGLDEGRALYAKGFFWEAHEAWEPVWLAAAPNSRERAFLQGIIQLANARLKLAMGRHEAAARIVARAGEHLDAAGLPGAGRCGQDWAQGELMEIRAILEHGYMHYNAISSQR
ncbi:DUF309 domain-containing protein [Sinisalibacter aestuarii]|uniref:DUF309 domain-containing protein n=1 Tax=Sinisalibacter aestuarii TaxID=2949426 RepID=A0ABQ5LSV2_9RHOB|nr:DUF309 domain-containing protein [Sinisalibacter aestuarii]GKY88043.1 hypothetical protein STA1M1_19120 [Sinisalibacter aestuarii]